MSITVKSWDAKELDAIRMGKNNWLTTVFLNKATFSQKEMKIYPYHKRKEYIVIAGGVEVKFYATDDKNAIRFVDAEYTGNPEVFSVSHKISVNKVR